MKRTLAAILVVGMVVLIGRPVQATIGKIGQFFAMSVCDVPVAYKIGSVDPRFDITESEVSLLADKAAAIWNRAAGKSLLTPGAKGPLTINLVYDGRQTLDTNIRTMESNLQSGRQSLESETEKFRADAAAFKSRVADLNARISEWNAKGGAPSEIYDQLQREQGDLQAEADRLNAKAAQLDIRTEQFNSGVEDLNRAVGQFNDTLKVKPEEGIYDPNTDTIDIYFNVSKDELVHNLAHEMGHALGLGHTDDASAIMYPYSSRTLVPTAGDTAGLAPVCRVPYWSRALEDASVRLGRRVLALESYWGGVMRQNVISPSGR